MSEQARKTCATNLLNFEKWFCKVHLTLQITYLERITFHLGHSISQLMQSIISNTFDRLVSDWHPDSSYSLRPNQHSFTVLRLWLMCAKRYLLAGERVKIKLLPTTASSPCSQFGILCGLLFKIHTYHLSTWVPVKGKPHCCRSPSKKQKPGVTLTQGVLF